ncbi:MAG: hypothetical protein EXR69_14195 [Myxococcales bacterium]|nr:hypothetical protein [Myxococcales bacterium]
MWKTVAAGQIAHRQSDEGVRGIGVIAESRVAIWLAITDDHPVDVVSGLTQVAWAGSWTGDKLLYQRLDLPWPFADRQWVARTETNSAMGGSGVWERAWANAPERLPEARSKTDVSAFDGAISIPVNRGSWILLDLTHGETLAIYQAQVRLGGELPAGAADQYAESGLPDFYRGTLKNAKSMHDRYVSSCVQTGGDGQVIPCFGD